MVRTFSSAFVGLVLALMTGCGITGLSSYEGMTHLPTGQSLVLFSTGVTSDSPNRGAVLRLVQGSTRKKYDKVFIEIDGVIPATSQFADELGRLHTLLLPPGEYFLVPGFADYISQTVLLAPIYRFDVMEGEVTYIGNFWRSPSQIIWRASTFRRDLDLYLAKNPDMKSVSVARRDAQYVGPITDFKVEGTIWGPIERPRKQ